MHLTDRSRQEKEWGCPRARFHEYHVGGTGVRPIARALPLATGAAVHDPLGALMRIIAETGEIPDPEITRRIVRAALAAYRDECKEAGFQGETSDAVEYVIAEQSCLIEGSFWAFYRVLLPWIVSEFVIICVEREAPYVMSCTCGLGVGIGRPRVEADGSVSHEGRPCDGVAQMTRADFLARRRSDGAVGCWEFKTSAYAFDRRQNEHLTQLGVNAYAAEVLLGEPVGHYYLVGLLKGKRDYDSKEARASGGIKKQHSILCYGYHKPVQLPYDRETAWRYEYTREKGFGKLPIWGAHFPDKPPEMSNAEWWVTSMMPQERVAEQLDLLGPSDRPDWVVTGVLRQRAELERKWADYRAPTTVDLEAETETLDKLAPQSWDCWPYERPCEFQPACNRYAGWQNPLTMGGFERRVPHHELEWRAQQQKREAK